AAGKEQRPNPVLRRMGWFHRTRPREVGQEAELGGHWVGAWLGAGRDQARGAGRLAFLGGQPSGRSRLLLLGRLVRPQPVLHGKPPEQNDRGDHQEEDEVLLLLHGRWGTLGRKKAKGGRGR